MGRWSDDNAPRNDTGGDTTSTGPGTSASTTTTTGTGTASGWRPGMPWPPPYAPPPGESWGDQPGVVNFAPGSQPAVGPNSGNPNPPQATPTTEPSAFDPNTGFPITPQAGAKMGGGWNTFAGTGQGQSVYAHALGLLLSQGKTGQDAVDQLNKDPATSGISYNASNGTYGLPGGYYVAPNTNNGGALDLIQRQPGDNGQSSTSPLNSLDPGSGFGSLLAPWTNTFSYDKFQAPTEAQAQATPGYQFAVDQGNQAIQRSAAARGTLLTGGTLKDLSNYQIGAADQNYNNVWNQAFTNWGTGYNNALGQYNMARDTFFANQDRPFNKLSALAGSGQVAATNLGNQDAAFVNTGANLITGSGNAQAAGIVGAANANSSFLSGVGNNALAMSYLSSFPQQGQ